MKLRKFVRNDDHFVGPSECVDNISSIGHKICSQFCLDFPIHLYYITEASIKLMQFIYPSSSEMFRDVKHAITKWTNRNSVNQRWL